MSEAKLVGVNCSEAQAAFVTRAAEAFIAAGHGKTKADFLRSALGRVSSAMLGEDWPADEPLTGPKDEIAKAAEKYGMTRPQFVKYASLVAAGVDAEKAKEIALKPPKTKAKPEGDATEAVTG